jgi:hypothetical protein
MCGLCKASSGNILSFKEESVLKIMLSNSLSFKRLGWGDLRLLFSAKLVVWNKQKDSFR